MPNTPAHIARFLDRVDRHLDGLDAAKATAFVNGQIRHWEGQYGDFIRRVAAGQATSPEVTAFDYVETIAGLARRLPGPRAVP